MPGFMDISGVRVWDAGPPYPMRYTIVFPYENSILTRVGHVPKARGLCYALVSSDAGESIEKTEQFAPDTMRKILPTGTARQSHLGDLVSVQDLPEYVRELIQMTLARFVERGIKANVPVRWR